MLFLKLSTMLTQHWYKKLCKKLADETIPGQTIAFRVMLVRNVVPYFGCNLRIGQCLQSLVVSRQKAEKYKVNIQINNASMRSEGFTVHLILSFYMSKYRNQQNDFDIYEY